MSALPYQPLIEPAIFVSACCLCSCEWLQAAFIQVPRVCLTSRSIAGAAEATCRALELDGLVIIGGDDSNTNSAVLAEYFMAKGEAGGSVGGLV